MSEDTEDTTSPEWMMKMAMELKTDGNAFYKQKQYQKALAKYTKIFLYVDHLTVPQDLKSMVGNKAPSSGSVKPEDIKKIQVVANQNCAMCYLRQERFDKSEEFCNRALKIKPDASKAIMIRGRARLRLKPPNLDGAQEDLNLAAKAFPNDKNIKNDLEALKKSFKKVRDKQRKLFAGMFDRKPDKKPKTEKKETPDGADKAKADNVADIISQFAGPAGAGEGSK
uniref:peptidylprolyl isomerase n=1 Tax=Lotharella globosa TaxID=91324 RepID=A0A7S3ZF81_9EUKA